MLAWSPHLNGVLFNASYGIKFWVLTDGTAMGQQHLESVMGCVGNQLRGLSSLSLKKRVIGN
jgi:hypothetical protein